VTTGGSGWALLTDHWRLKALSAVLAVILFGTVAFAQNPITVRTLSVRITGYQNADPSLVLIKYPTHVEVQAVGLADAVNPLTPDDIVASMDLSKVAVPTDQPQTVQVNVAVRTVAPGVTLQQSSIPVYITVDHKTSASIPIQVIDQAVPGLTVDSVVVDRPGTTDPVSSVSLSGAASIVETLKALVDLGPLDGGGNFVGLNVTFEDSSGKTVKWPPATIPLATADLTTVDVHVAAHQTQQQKQVAALVTLSGSPACGYAVAGITVAPALVTLTGDATSLGAAGSSIALSTVDITGATSTVVSRQKVSVPANTTVSPATVTVTVTLKQVASCTPASPQVTPSSAPSP
jgi:hypothetical protein